MFASLRDLEVEVGGMAEHLDLQVFLRLVSGLVRVSKGVEIELTEADIDGDSEEFCREYKAELEQMLSRRPEIRR